jgi:hypothetical protein
LTSNPTVDQATSDVPLPTQDGGNSSDTKEPMLSTREEKFLKSKVTSTLRTETSVSTTQLEVFTKSGISSMLMNGKVNQEKENLTRSSASMLKDHSTLFQK